MCQKGVISGQEQILLALYKKIIILFINIVIN